MGKADGLGHKIMTTEPRAKTLKMMIDKYHPEVPLTGINKQWLEQPLLIITNCEKEAGHTTFVRTQLKLTDFRDTFDNYSLHNRVDLYYAPNDSHNNPGFIARIVKVGIDKSVDNTKKYSDCVIAPLDPFRYSFWLCPEYTDTAEHTGDDYKFIKDDGSFITKTAYDADNTIAKYKVLSRTNKGTLPEEYEDAMDYRFCMCERITGSGGGGGGDIDAKVGQISEASFEGGLKSSNFLLNFRATISSDTYNSDMVTFAWDTRRLTLTDKDVLVPDV